jgi:hypothetical protein
VEISMRKTTRTTTLALSAAAALFATGAMMPSANAVPLANPGGMRAAVDDAALLDKVHCRPGWRHHRPSYWRYSNGCRRHHYRGPGVYISPGLSFGWAPGWHGGRHHHRHDHHHGHRGHRR